MSKTYYQRGIKITLLMVGLGFLLVVFFVQGANVGYTFATFNTGSDKDKDNNKSDSGLELTVDSRTVYNGVLQPALTWNAKHLVPGVDHFFNFGDVKPGDMGLNTISLHVKKNSAYVCLDFNNLNDKENGINEPESNVDSDQLGELSKNLEFFAWRDDGDNTFEVGEKTIFGTATQTANVLLSSTTYAVADTQTGNSCQVNSVNYVGIIWCAGDLTVNTVTAKVSCDGSKLGNIVQTDSMSVDISLRAVQADHNQGFMCIKEKPKPECKDKDDKECKSKGNNGHGNDADHNDDSNPGHSNTVTDTTDDDGVPGHAKIAPVVESNTWYQKDTNSSSSIKEKLVKILNKVKNYKRT